MSNNNRVLHAKEIITYDEYKECYTSKVKRINAEHKQNQMLKYEHVFAHS